MNHTARTIALLASGVTSLCGFGSALHAQVALPPTAPTTITASQLPSANPPVPTGASDVQWDGHFLCVTASGSSLVEVLNQIATRAGIRMSGSPPADRIFGTYGPAPLQDVLSDLVSGLPVNMLFVDRAGTIPARLTFTARNGAPTPPMPAQTFAQREQQQPTTAIQNTPPRQQPASGVPANPGFTPPGGASTATGSTNGEPPATASQPADGSGNPSSPNGVKTPQEIFEQLQRLRANAGAQH